MKTFNDIKKYFAIFGITSPQSARMQLLNARIFFTFFIHGLEVFQSGAYIYRITDVAFAEYVDTYFRITVVITLGMFFATVVWNMPELYRFIDGLEKLITESE